jgi:hypothetical protein
MSRCEICGKRRKLIGLHASDRSGTVDWCRSVCRECSAAVLDMVLRLAAGWRP